MSAEFILTTAAPCDYQEVLRFYSCEGTGAFRELPRLDSAGERRLLDQNWVRIVLIRRSIDHQIVTAGLLAVYQSFSGTIGHIDYILVHRDLRGRGLSRRLMDELHGQARQLGVTRLELTSRPSRVEARALYESLGYQLVEGSNRHYRLPLGG